MGVKKEGLIYFPRWVELFIIIDEDNLSNISRKTETTYSHVYKISKEMEKKELVTIKKIGRDCVIKYTEKGKKIKQLLIECRGLL